MNCKPGDLAVVVRCCTNPEDVGRLVTVLEIIAEGHWWADPEGGEHPGSGYAAEFVGGPGWVKTLDDKKELSRYCSFAFRCLRPIRDSDGADETLSWAGKPQPVDA